MKLKFLVFIITAIIGEREPDADMFLPSWVLAFGAVLIIACPVLAVLFFVKDEIFFIILAVAALVMGILAIMCWRNQNIKVLNSEEFQYTTFLGKKKVYRFNDITGMRRNRDSCTLYVAGEKVHMESCAIISDRLSSLIDSVLFANEK